MNKKILSRVLKESEYILKTQETVRKIAMIFGVSKSTVHKDLSERLLEIDKEKHGKVMQILKYHTDVRHIRGGEATKLKFLAKKSN